MLFDYKLIIDPNDNDLGPVHFIASRKITGLDIAVKVNITCRNVSQYPALPINPDWQYLEIGSGVAEFIPYLCGHVKKRPIAIEMADYNSILTLVDGIPKKHESVAKELRDRIAVYTDSSKVRLENRSLGEAATDSSLHGIADVVIDWAGAGTYADTELLIDDLQGDRKKLRDRLETKIEAFEKLFLKPGGIYITSPSFKR